MRFYFFGLFLLPFMLFGQYEEHYKTAYYLLSEGSLFESAQAFKSIYDTDTSEILALKERANIEYDLENYFLAKELYHLIIDKEQGFYPAYFNLGSTYNELEQDSIAVYYYSQGIALKGFDVDMLYNRAYSYLILEDYQAALADYNKILEVFPENIEVLFGKAEVLESLEEFDSAGKVYGEIVKYDSTQLDAWYYQAFYDSSKIEEALEFFDKFLDGDANNEAALFYSAALHYELNELDISLNRLNRLLFVVPNDIEYLHARAGIYLERKDSLRAIFDYNLILSIDPEDADARYYRGECFITSGDYDKAINDFQYLIDHDSHDIDTYFALADVYTRMEVYETAFEYLDVILSYEPDNAEAVYEKGVVYSQMNKMKKACSHWFQSIEMGYEEAKETCKEWCK